MDDMTFTFDRDARGFLHARTSSPDGHPAAGLLMDNLCSLGNVTELLESLQRALGGGARVDETGNAFTVTASGSRAMIEFAIDGSMKPVRLDTRELIGLLEAWRGFLQRGTPTRWTVPARKLTAPGASDPRPTGRGPGSPLSNMIAILRKARGLIARPGEESPWSGWQSQEEALKEMDDRIGELQVGAIPRYRDLWVLFAPTGPIQDWSIDNGWGEEFIELASRFDEALAALYPDEPPR